MFGCVVAGRLIQTNMQEIDETHAAFELSSASTINHICVFLLGTVPFPDGYGATVHLFWPGKGFQLLGALSNEKPSAIFRLRGTFSASTTVSNTTWANPAAPTTTDADVTAVLGIAVEPLEAIQTQLDTLASAVTKPSSSVNDATLLAERIVKHLFNYLSGFVEGTNGMGVTPESYVQMRTITRWYETFMTKIRTGGTTFLERAE